MKLRGTATILENVLESYMFIYIFVHQIAQNHLDETH